MFDPRDILADSPLGYDALARLPAWPGHPGCTRGAPSSFDPTTDELTISIGGPETTGDSCAICSTPVTLRQDVGWTHDVGFKARGGCTIAWPGG